MNRKLITSIVCLLSTLAFALMVAHLPAPAALRALIAAVIAGMLSVYAFILR